MPSRRQFLQQASTAALACGSSTLFGRLVSAQATSTADQTSRIFIDSRRSIAPLDRNLFGSFLEQLGRAIYEGIYDPGSKLADSNVFRKDVMQEVRSLGVPIIRYPGGNFVSGYNWLDGVGPKHDRPHVLDKAWDSMNSNQFGTNEYMQWCEAVGTLPLMGLNLGTGTPEQAAALLEYCNVEKGTQWSDLRRKHGYAEPYNVKHWCIGNEMDGPWQIGHVTATEYGMKAQDTARQMRYVDHSVQLIACGSSGPFMPTYLEWDREVLEQCYDYVDGLSLHRYLGNNKSPRGSAHLEGRIVLVVHSGFYREVNGDPWIQHDVEAFVKIDSKGWKLVAKTFRPLLEKLLQEAGLDPTVLVGGMLNTLMRNADRVKIACLAQLINVIAPIMTNENGLFRQTIYYPYAWALQYARGRVLNVLVESPTYDAKGLDAVPYLDAVATNDNGQTTLFILNRDLSKARTVDVIWEDQSPNRVLASQLLTGNDLKAVNGFDAPERVKPQAFDKPNTSNGRTRFEVPARSYTVIQWGA